MPWLILSLTNCTSISSHTRTIWSTKLKSPCSGVSTALIVRSCRGCRLRSDARECIVARWPWRWWWSRAPFPQSPESIDRFPFKLPESTNVFSPWSTRATFCIDSTVGVISSVVIEKGRDWRDPWIRNHGLETSLIRPGMEVRVVVDELLVDWFRIPIAPHSDKRHGSYW